MPHQAHNDPQRSTGGEKVGAGDFPCSVPDSHGEGGTDTVVETVVLGTEVPEGGGDEEECACLPLTNSPPHREHLNPHIPPQLQRIPRPARPIPRYVHPSKAQSEIQCYLARTNVRPLQKPLSRCIDGLDAGGVGVVA